MPERQVYAWFWKYYPEFEVYRAIMWMGIPFEDADKCRYSKYIPIIFVPERKIILGFLNTWLEEEFKTNAQKGLRKA